MTREEAIRNIEEAISLNSEYIFIHEIYNDFESMTCENCRHYAERIQGYGECGNVIYETFSVGLVDGYEQNFIPQTFGCNEWESK